MHAKCIAFVVLTAMTGKSSISQVHATKQEKVNTMSIHDGKKEKCFLAYLLQFYEKMLNPRVASLMLRILFFIQLIAEASNRVENRSDVSQNAYNEMK